MLQNPNQAAQDFIGKRGKWSAFFQITLRKRGSLFQKRVRQPQSKIGLDAPMIHVANAQATAMMSNDLIKVERKEATTCAQQ